MIVKSVAFLAERAPSKSSNIYITKYAKKKKQMYYEYNT